MSSAPERDAPSSLAEVAATVRACTRCPLAQSRTQAVPGDGPADARVMFIGEGPGYHEDRQGSPFVGPAGQLLDTLLASAGLARADVFITNIVKCRPPGNRDPVTEEMAACRPYLEEQLALIQPAIIVTLGRFALEHFIPGARVSAVHGQARRVAGRTFVPMLHPAAALHRPEWRPQLEGDFAALRRVLDEATAAAERSAAPDSEPNDDGPAEQLSLF